MRGKKETECSACFKLLGVPSRMFIYSFLSGKGEASVREIVGVAKLKQPTVSYHLRKMKKLGLLTSRREGKEIYYKAGKKCPHGSRICVLLKVKP